MDFVFQDHIRWSLWFDNPNFAGAFIAGLIPWLWFPLWRLAEDKRWVSRLVYVGAWLANIALWFLLVLTYSRGAVAAVLAALGYWAWKSRQACTNTLWLSSLLVLLLFLLATQGDQRLVNGMFKPDDSMSNRWILWMGGLQMLAENPQGVGSGNAGEYFMQWYQPLSMTAAYRTLVNGHLTWAVEYGVFVFWALAFLFLLIWRTASVADQKENAISLPVFMLNLSARAALMAFMVGGLFNTIFECKSLWVIPLASMAVLIISGLRCRRRCAPGMAFWWTAGRHGLFAGVLALLLVLGLLTAGYAVNREDGLSRNFLGENSVLIHSRQGVADHSVLFLVDKNVCGAHYGKLIRRVCAERGYDALVVWGEETVRSRIINDYFCRVEAIVAAGRTVNADLFATLTFDERRLILLAPEALKQDGGRAAIMKAGRIVVFLPGLETDGRDRWWIKAFNPLPANVCLVELEGIGLDVSWKWDDIARKLH